jgi:hypothetical protein
MAGEVPRHFFCPGGAVAELSIFADESGDFGTESEYYIVSFVFHEQHRSIADQVARLSESLGHLGFDPDHAVHTGAIIRREDDYELLSIATRKAAFTRLFAFARSVEFTYQTFRFRKREHPDRLKLKGAISKGLWRFLQDNAAYFLSFDRVIVYYDNGQSEITDVLNTLFNAFFFEVDFRRAAPSRYRLFQVADLLCTLELLQAKLDNARLSKTDLYFFTSRRALRKDYLTKLEGKRFRGSR